MSKEIRFECEDDHPKIWFESYSCPICSGEVVIFNVNLKKMLLEIENEISFLEPEVTIDTSNLDRKLDSLKSFLVGKQ